MNIKKTRFKLNKRNKILAIVAALAVIALSTLGVYLWINNDSSSSSSDQSSIDYNPPTEEQKEDGARIKDTVINSEDTNEPETGQKRSVDVTVVDAGQYERTIEVRAFAAGIAESDGTCTATFTKGTSTLSRTSPTIISANTTQCVPLKISSAEFASLGEWSVIVQYESTSSSGKSIAQTITVK